MDLKETRDGADWPQVRGVKEDPRERLPAVVTATCHPY